MGSTASRYVIRRDDGAEDGIAGQRFTRYDDAYAVLERYYADLCCSDEREFYRIEEEATAAAPPEPSTLRQALQP